MGFSGIRRIRFLPLVGALCGVTGHLAAQTDVAVQPGPGQRVRVVCTQAGNSPLIGTVLSHDQDSLRLELASWADPVSLPHPTIRRIEVSSGPQSNADRGALRGAVVGALAGMVAGLLATNSQSGTANTPAARALLGATLFGLTGAGFGAAIGSFSESERWTEVPLEQQPNFVSP
jgi:hypothetical protein